MTLYISDLDGTLLNYRAQLKSRAAEMLSRMAEKGVMFTYATARRFTSTENIMKEANISLPAVTMNGAIIVDGKTGKLLKINGFRQGQLEEAKQLIVDSSYDPSFGARPLKRYIQRNLETLIAREILADNVHQGDTIKIGVSDGELTVCR